MTSSSENVERDGAEYRLVAGTCKGTITTEQVDAGSVANRYWSILVSAYERDFTPGRDCTWPANSGEARTRTGLSREASPNKPGADFTRTGNDCVEPASVSLLRGCGPAGSYGKNTRV